MRVLVEDEIKREACAIYTADVLGSLTTAFFRAHGAEDVEIPLFSEMGKPKKKPETAAEIKQRILNRLNELDPVIPDGGFKGR